MVQDLNDINSFTDSLLLHCEEPNIIQNFQANILNIDKQYTDSITKIIREIDSYIGKSLISNNVGDESRCVGLFANCFVKLLVQTHPRALCYENNPRKEHRDTFTFLVLVELLLALDCKNNLEECRFRDNDDKKTLIRFLLNEYFIEKDENYKVTFLNYKEKCKDLLKQMSYRNFTSKNVQDQIDDIEMIKTKCMDGAIYDDYNTYQEEFDNLQECQAIIKGCSKGKFSSDCERNRVKFDSSIKYFIVLTILFSVALSENNLDIFLKESLICNFARLEEAPAVFFDLQYDITNDEYFRIVQNNQELLIDAIYDLTDDSGSLPACYNTFHKFLTEHAQVYKLFLASKAAGIYECPSNCTFRMIENPNLLLNYTRFLLLDEKMDSILKRTCNNEDPYPIDCINKINEIRNDDFTKNDFETQISSIAHLIERVTYEMESVYMALVDDGILKDCESEIQQQCIGILFASFS